MSRSRTDPRLARGRGGAAAGGGGASAAAAGIKEVFRKHDRDGNGGLNKMEFVNLLTGCGMKRTNAMSIFKIVDANDDQLIDYEEFIDWLHNKDGQMASHKSSPNRNAAEHVLKFSTFKDTRVGQTTATPQENLMKRFPHKSEQEVRQALLYAKGHGGEAAAILAGEIKPDKSTSRVGHMAYSLSGAGTGGQLKDLYGI